VSSRATNVLRDITLSVVSHRQNALVNRLLEDIARVCAERLTVVITENVADQVELRLPSTFPAERIVNQTVKGFGANHNAAFKHCRTPYFCVVNPDIRLPADPFPVLLESLRGARVAAVGPLVRSPHGSIEDSARRFPTLGFLLRKAVRERRAPDYPTDAGPVEVDWVAGMFMLFHREAFATAEGFDEAYFLYYEDVDLCHRLRMRGLRTLYEPRAEVVHDAQRASRRNPARALRHLASATRFLARRHGEAAQR
jgi:GT2 family glycosyltransferase